MTQAPPIPVLVGVGAISQRLEDPAAALEPAALMVEAARRAGADAGAPGLLAQADSIRVPRGFWAYPDPGRLIAEAIGAPGARTVVSEIGVLQTTLLGHAARDIAQGTADIIVVAGAEAKHRALRAQITGVEAELSVQEEIEPDLVLRPQGDILHPLEIQQGLIMPVQQYSMIENALRAHEGLSIAAHRDEVARLWSAMSDVAAKNPEAWNRVPISAQAIRDPGDGNRMLAFPYTKHHNSQWNVDQGAALLLCSAETARRAGVPEDRWVYPWSAAESNHMLTMCERATPYASPGFKISGRHVFDHAGIEPDGVSHRELYSCFPSAVRIQARELGFDEKARLTETGGMTFAGGPLNNFVLQAMARMAQVLRDDPESLGLVTAVSGVLTKQGVTLWSTGVPRNPFAYRDASEEVARATETVDFLPDLEGPARIVAYTVPYEGDAPSHAVALCELEDGRRTLARTSDPAHAIAMTEEEFCGRSVTLSDGELS